MKSMRPQSLTPSASDRRAPRSAILRALSLLITATTALAWSIAAQATTIGPDAYGYTATDTVGFAFEDISGTGTSVLAGADDGAVTVPLGFTFNIYGNAFTSVSFSSNGLISFGGQNAQFSNVNIATFSPSLDVPSIAVAWDDWQFFQSGSDAVYYQTLGSPGSRRFVVTWRIAHGFFSSPSDVTFQAILTEGSDSILLQYLDIDSGDFRAFGANATVGIRDTNGQSNGRNLQWSVNSAALSNGQAILFSLCDHDGTIDLGEECDDNNLTSGDGCSAACRIEPCHTCTGAPSICTTLPLGTACGSSSDTECTNPDTCNATGTCLSNDEVVGTSCGDPTDDECTNPDTCNGSGACLANNEVLGTTCGDQSDTECTNPDFCNGFGNCLANNEPFFQPCGDPSSSECDQPDYCDGTGFCYANPVFPGAACGDPSDTECDNPDSCDGAGSCAANLEPPATSCGDLSATDCSNPDSCDGAGTCLSNDLPVDTFCNDEGNECTKNLCDGAGSCLHPAEPAGLSCGSPADTDCSNPDTCDGAGGCAVNDEPLNTPCTDDGNQCTQNVCNGGGSCTHPNEPSGTSCGSPADTQCDNPDTCDGSGACLANFEVNGTACGDPSDTECTNPDTCNGSGTCLGNHEPSGTACGDHSDTECTDPDTCSGSGTCLSNHAAELTPCHGGNNNTCLNACTTGACTPHFFNNCCGNGTLEGSELCDDGNQVSGDECRPTCRLNLDNFQCYRAGILQTHASPGVKVLVDQFHTINATVGTTRSVCNPAAANNDDLQAVTHTEHLQNYAVRTDPRKDIAAVLPVRDIKVVDQFGTHYVDATRPKGLLVPSNKEISSQPPPLLTPDLDHFTCYNVKRSKGRPKFTPIQSVEIDDEFASYSVKVTRPSRLCLPTNKYNEEPGAENHIAHLMCYRVSGKFSTPGRVFTNNQFGPSELFVRFPNELCVPAVKNPS